VGSFWGRCGARPKGQGQARGQDGGFSFLFCLFGVGFLFFLSEHCQPHSSPHPHPCSLIGSDIIFLSQLCCGWLRGRGKGQGARQGARGTRCFVSFRLRELGVLAACLWCSFSNAHCLALLPQPHPRRSALLGPIRIETLALCRILPEGLRSSIGLLSRLWRGGFGRVWRALPPPFFFVRGCSPICET
jgi:hypothetical protein